MLVNGINGARIAQTAAEGDLARNDRRTIVGTRYEHDFGPNTTWRTQATFDSRVVNQPTSATPFKGTLDSYNITSDVTDRGALFGMDATSFVGVFYNYLDNQSFSFNKTPAGRNGFGAPTQTVFGDIRNIGARAREELQITPRLQLIAGIGAERSIIDVRQTAYSLSGRRQPGAQPDPGRAAFLQYRAGGRLVLAGDRRGAAACPGRHRLWHSPGGQSVRHAGGRARRQCRSQVAAEHRRRSRRRDRAGRHAQGRSDRLL